MQLSRKDLLLMRQCDGVHGTIEALFECVSCSVILTPQKIDVEYIDTPIEYVMFRSTK